VNDLAQLAAEPPSLQKILRLEAALLEMTDHHLEPEVRHYFSQGVYARELFIPKGAVLTGKIHLTEHLSLLVQGELSVMTDSGVQRLKAPYVVNSKPGMKRAGYAHEDSRWITIHVTNETDLEKLEAELVTNDVTDPRLPIEFRRLLK